MVKSSLLDEGFFAKAEGFADAADVDFDRCGSHRLCFLLLSLGFLRKGGDNRDRAYRFLFLLEGLGAQGDYSFPKSLKVSLMAATLGQQFFNGHSLNM